MQLFFSSDNEFPLSQVSTSSSRLAIWECDQGHHSTKTVAEASRYPRCGQCLAITRGNVTVGVNDLATTHPQVLALWSPANDLPPTCYTAQSTAKVSINGAVQSIRAWATVNTAPKGALLRQLRPDLAAWVQGDTSQLTVSSSKTSTSFKCPSGHEFTGSVRNLLKAKTPCPVCGLRVLVPGTNSFDITHPVLAAQAVTNPASFMASSTKPADWKCTLGHTWSAPVAARVAGARCPFCAGVKVLVGVNDLATRVPGVVALWSNRNPLPATGYFSGGDVLVWLNCSSCSAEFKISCYQIRRVAPADRLCSQCARSQSKPQRELETWIQETFPGENVVFGDRTVLAGKELDVWFPDRGLAIEMNGVYWHSEAAGKDKWYHVNKTTAAATAGVQLLHLWSDTWDTSRQAVQTSIAHRLQASSLPKIGARKTTVERLAPEAAREFFNKYHVQGAPPVGQFYGLLHQGELVAAMAWTRSKAGDTLQRYATSCVVAGGFTKLLLASRTQAPVITFADKSWVSGVMYESTGFRAVKELAPDYQYLVGDRRVHKFMYRLSRFKTDPNLVYEEGLSETELARLNGLTRTWDCGKTKFMLA